MCKRECGGGSERGVDRRNRSKKGRKQKAATISAQGITTDLYIMLTTDLYIGLTTDLNI